MDSVTSISRILKSSTARNLRTLSTRPCLMARNHTGFVKTEANPAVRTMNQAGLAKKATNPAVRMTGSQSSSSRMWYIEQGPEEPRLGTSEKCLRTIIDQSPGLTPLMRRAFQPDHHHEGAAGDGKVRSNDQRRRPAEYPPA